MLARRQPPSTPQVVDIVKAEVAHRHGVLWNIELRQERLEIRGRLGCRAVRGHRSRCCLATRRRADNLKLWASFTLHTSAVTPEVTVTSGITAAARDRGDLFTVMPEVGPTPYTGH
jgi:hypothetical protein